MAARPIPLPPTLRRRFIVFFSFIIPHSLSGPVAHSSNYKYHRGSDVLWMCGGGRRMRNAEAERSINFECGMQRRTLVIILPGKREAACRAEVRYQLTRLAG